MGMHSAREADPQTTQKKGLTFRKWEEWKIYIYIYFIFTWSEQQNLPLGDTSTYQCLNMLHKVYATHV